MSDTTYFFWLAAQSFQVLILFPPAFGLMVGGRLLLRGGDHERHVRVGAVVVGQAESLTYGKAGNGDDVGFGSFRKRLSVK